MAGFISEADAAVLLAARDVCLKLERAVVRDRPTEVEWVDALSRGRFAETCEVARRACFDVLNVADSYLEDAVARNAVARSH